jgi:hypothetical protein
MEKPVEDKSEGWGYIVEPHDLDKVLAINCLIIERVDELLSYVRQLKTCFKKIEKPEDLDALRNLVSRSDRQHNTK